MATIADELKALDERRKQLLNMLEDEKPATKGDLKQLYEKITSVIKECMQKSSVDVSNQSDPQSVNVPVIPKKAPQ